jgi:hypothetical protein
MYKRNDYENLITSRFLEDAIISILLMRDFERKKAEALALKLSLYFLDLEEEIERSVL